MSLQGEMALNIINVIKFFGSTIVQFVSLPFPSPPLLPFPSKNVKISSGVECFKELRCLCLHTIWEFHYKYPRETLRKYHIPRKWNSIFDPVMKNSNFYSVPHHIPLKWPTFLSPPLPLSIPECELGQFSCGGSHSQCIPEEQQCDGERNCDNGADENNCNGKKEHLTFTI